MARLGLTHEQVREAADSQLKAMEAARRRARAIDLLGATFDGEDASVHSIWRHLAGLGGAAKGAGLRLDANVEMQEWGSRPGQGQRLGGGGRGIARERRMTDAQKNLVGFTGEALAFAWLRAEYGETSVPASSWVSKYSEVAFGARREVSDDLGYDFHLRDIEGKDYFVEVKASTGSATEFNLGSSEIRAAVAQAGGQLGVYVILHVVDVATASPKARLLPNPFDGAFAASYRLEGAGQRVRYELAPGVT
jgi:multidrug efflux pump subunit AcrA (membrane-fusion protein)